MAGMGASDERECIMVKSLKKCFIYLALLGFLIPGIAGGSFADVIIDNGATGTSYTGTWYASGGTDPYGASSLWSRNGTTYTFSMSGQAAGTYEVLMWWSGYSSRASNVPVAINHASGTTSVTVDQSQDPGQWNSLGTYFFNGSGSVRITAATGDTLSTCADAVKFTFVSGNAAPTATIDSITPNPASPGESITLTGHGTDTDGTITAYEWTSSMDGTIGAAASFSTSTLSEGTHTITFRVKDNEDSWSPGVTASLVVGTPSVEVIIDNGGSGTSYTGTWAVSGGTDPYGTNSVWARNGVTYTFAMSGQVAGNYEVLMWWSGYSSRATSVPVAINYTGGTGNITVNQRQNPGQWNSLGTYYFDGSGSVTITAATGDTLSTCADAVKFTLVSSNSAPTATIDSIAPNPASQGESITLTGHGTDTDGTIAAYEWTSSMDGTIGAAASFSISTLSAGTHTITFRVKDDKDAWSPAVTSSLVVNGVNAAPTATIDSITPNPASPGESITLTGHGTDTDGTITAYEWTSSMDGTIGAAASFSISTLSAGTHTITFRVKDNDGAWSSGVTSSLVVNSGTPSVEVIIDNGGAGTSYTGSWAVSGGTDPYGTNSVWARNGVSYTFAMIGQVAGNYEVFMWWSGYSSRAASIPVAINHASGTTSVTVNQQQNPGQWNSLGTYYFDGSGSVTITAATGDTLSTCADAVKFTLVSSETAPIADFSADRTSGTPPLTVQFSDTSLGTVTSWLWSFGDGSTSTAQNPVHTYTVTGSYTVSLTVTNSVGSSTKSVAQYINLVSSGEHIYLCDGYAEDALFIPHANTLLQGMGAYQDNGVWVYQDTVRGRTVYIHTVTDPETMAAALKQEGAHIIFNGHANFGLGATFATIEEVGTQEITTIRYIDDDRFTNFSSDMVSVKIDGVQYGQAYPNWLPIYKDGTSGIMPYTFLEGRPPYNYYLTYKIAGDPTIYRIELANGTWLERFPDSATPAWFSATGAEPDPAANPEYFIVNTDTDFNRCDFTGTWPFGKVPGGGYMGEDGYLGYNYQYHAAGTGANKATWTLVVHNPGYYAVLASWYPSALNASNAKYTINYAGGSAIVEVDQRQSDLINPLGYYYFDTGIYTVELSDNANARVVADVVALSAVSNPVKILQAEFNANVISGTTPLAVQFTDLSALYSMEDTSIKITGWNWNFGDGSTSSQQHPSHTYSTAGTYTVTLKITDSTGATDTETKTGLITVGTTPSLRAQFTSASRMGSDRTVVKFIDQSSGNITGWSWSFGDGSTSAEKNPTHTYTVPGTYTVSLTVTGTGGNHTETETGFVNNIIGLVYADNTAHHKPHFYSRSTGSPITFGKVILDARRAKIPEEDLRYSRMFYGSCNSCSYYGETFQRGVMFCTTGDSDSYTALDYLEYYLKGNTDEQLLSRINSIQPIHELINFNLKPPSLR